MVLELDNLKEEQINFKTKILISIIYISFMLWTKILFEGNVNYIFEYRVNPKLVVPIVLLLIFFGMNFLSKKIQRINNINILLKLCFISIIMTMILYVVDYVKYFQNAFIFSLLTFIWVFTYLLVLTIIFDFFSKRIKYNKVFELLGLLLILTKMLFSLIQFIEYNFKIKNYDLNVSAILIVITFIAVFLLNKEQKKDFSKVDNKKNCSNKYNKIYPEDGEKPRGISKFILKKLKSRICLEVFIVIVMIIVLNILINIIDGYLLIYLFEVNQINSVSLFYGNIFMIDIFVCIFMFILIKYIFSKSKHLDVFMVIFLTCLAFGVILLILDMKINTVGYFLISISYLFLDLYLWTIIIRLPQVVMLSNKIYFVALGAYVISISLGKILFIYLKNKSDCLLVCLICILICFVIFYILQQYYNKVLLLSEEKYRENLVREKNNQINVRLELLTEKENEIVQLMLKGLKNKDIAKEVFISENTLKTHARNIYQKLDVTNKKELIEKSKFLLK